MIGDTTVSRKRKMIRREPGRDSESGQQRRGCNIGVLRKIITPVGNVDKFHYYDWKGHAFLDTQFSLILTTNYF